MNDRNIEKIDELKERYDSIYNSIETGPTNDVLFILRNMHYFWNPDVDTSESILSSAINRGDIVIVSIILNTSTLPMIGEREATEAGGYSLFLMNEEILDYIINLGISPQSIAESFISNMGSGVDIRIELDLIMSKDIIDINNLGRIAVRRHDNISILNSLISKGMNNIDELMNIILYCNNDDIALYSYMYSYLYIMNNRHEAETILEKYSNIDYNDIDVQDILPLIMYSSKDVQVELIKKLIREGRTTLALMALYEKSPSSVEFLGSYNMFDIIDIAILYENIAILEYIISRGYDPNYILDEAQKSNTRFYQQLLSRL